jgi:hypothetical protein
LLIRFVGLNSIHNIHLFLLVSDSVGQVVMSAIGG